MQVQIMLHDGTNITANIEGYNAAELAAKLNDQKVLMVTAGDIIVNKNAVKLVVPVVES